MTRNVSFWMHEFPITNISPPIDRGMATGGTLTTERFLFNFVGNRNEMMIIVLGLRGSRPGRKPNQGQAQRKKRVHVPGFWTITSRVAGWIRCIHAPSMPLLWRALSVSEVFLSGIWLKGRREKRKRARSFPPVGHAPETAHVESAPF